MKCQLCDNWFYQETIFGNLFEFPQICAECQRKFKAEPKIESYPFSYGVLDHIYLYSDIQINAKQKHYLGEKHVEFFLMISGKRLNQAILLFIDDQMYNSFSEWFPFLKPFGSIGIMSLTRYDFDGFMNFF